MKKTLAVMLLLMLVVMPVAWAAENWTCPSCNAKATGKFCSNCGQAKPDENADAKNGITLKLNITFSENLIFLTYDVDMYIDDTLVASMEHGEDVETSLKVEKGKHLILFQKKGDAAVRGTAMVNVEEETFFECTIYAHADEITVKKVNTNGAVSSEEEETASREQYISACKSIKYAEIERNPDIYEGELIKVSGKVTYVSESWLNENSITIRIKDSNGDTWYGTYERPKGSMRILEDDRVTLYGSCNGVENYIGDWAQSYTVPAIKIKYFDLK